MTTDWMGQAVTDGGRPVERRIREAQVGRVIIGHGCLPTLAASEGSDAPHEG